MGFSAGLRRHSRQSAGRGILADDGGDMDLDVQEAAGSGGCRRGAEILRLVVRERGEDGGGTRLHCDAEERRRQRQEDFGGRGEGRIGQAALRNGPLSWPWSTSRCRAMWSRPTLLPRGPKRLIGCVASTSSSAFSPPSHRWGCWASSAASLLTGSTASGACSYSRRSCRRPCNHP